MKMIHKVALGVLSMVILIGLGTHIDSVYHNKIKQNQTLNTQIDHTDKARKIVKKTKDKRKKKMELAQAQLQSQTENGGISLHMFDTQQGQSYLLFKKVEKHYGFMNELDKVTVAIPLGNEKDIKDAKLWGKSGKFKLYAKQVNDWEKPAHDTRDYVWVSEQEIKKAIGIAQASNPQGLIKNTKVSIRTKHGQKVELDKHLISALSNHYGKLNIINPKKEANQKVSQVIEKKKITTKKAKTKVA